MNNFLNNLKIIGRTSIILVVVLSLIVLPGCNILKEKSPQQPQQEEQAEKIPKQLESIESSIENIFMVLDGPSIGKKEEAKQKQGQAQKDQKGQQEGQQQQQASSKDQQKSGDQKQQGQEKDQSQEQNQSQQKEASQGQEQKQDPWQQISEEIKSLHSSWNEYMPEVTKKGARKDLIDGFSDALNDLTKIAEGKDRMKTLLAASSLHKNIPDFYALYKTKVSPELKRVIYYTRNSVLNSITGDWTKASSDMEDLKSTWSFMKNTIAKEQQEDATKLDLSIYELEKVIKEKNRSLVEIKGKLTLANVESLQKSIEKGSK